MDITSYSDIEELYAICCNMKFQASMPLAYLIEQTASEIPVASQLMLFTAHLSKKLLEELELLKGNTGMTTVFYMKHSMEENQELETLFSNTVRLVPVALKEDVISVLEGRKNE